MNIQDRIAAANEEIKAYRKWYQENISGPTTSLEDTALRRQSVTIVAEGDSWFNYIIGKDIIWWLREKYNHTVHEVAYPGATLNHMAYAPDISELGDWDDSKLTQLGETLYRIEEHSPRIILLSGGGNDVAGPEFIQLVKHANAPVPGANDKVVEGLLDSYDEAYGVMLAAIEDTVNKKGLTADIILHGYDLPFPNGKGAGWGPITISGPWFHDSFLSRGYPLEELETRREIVANFMNRFNERLDRLAQQSDRVHYLNLRGTLPDEDLWANELHPKDKGFGEIAAKFDGLIQSLVLND